VTERQAFSKTQSPAYEAETRMEGRKSEKNARKLFRIFRNTGTRGAALRDAFASRKLLRVRQFTKKSSS
jgi:hypothetical protein